ncbi:hypothetical protein BJ973_004020 [Actinoplanes tereljensis]|uniref:Uncharacterized protein n=1 Tax=Paractinoplanes tereljensis TaxID=571912 RepID=A0A919TYY8_9ACTN|nr:hypothetical protein [Actinoplanes tereljensis]GIF25745.1 hypothetical protein Ate02nite_84750 [Actinoplanes tereljensis]
MPDGVQIDTDKVGEVGRDLQTDAESGFAVAADRGASLHRHGVEFAARLTPSSAATEAKIRYAQALANTEANLRAHHAAAGVLAGAAQEIARLFATSDMTSAHAQRKVQDLIHDAVRAADAAVGSTTDGAV